MPFRTQPTSAAICRSPIRPYFSIFVYAIKKGESLNASLPLLIYRLKMFDWSLDPRSQLALLCLITAFVFWNNDALFFTFCTLAFCTRVSNL